MFDLAELHRAHEVVGAILPPTPQFAWPLLRQRLGTDIVVKHENHQPTGAFKVRGGITYLDRVRRERPEVTGLTSATRGNHGQSLAFACRQAGLPVTIFVPHGNSQEKNQAMRAWGADLREHGTDFEAARLACVEFAEVTGREMVPSFHRDLVVGVSTYALELLTAEPDLDRIYVPIGMGSGAAGCIMARDLLQSRAEIVGVQATGANSYALSFEAGRIVSTPSADTHADGLATRVPDEQALSILMRGLARVVEVSDDEIAEAIRIYWTDTHNLAEGAGAAPLAAAMRERDTLRGRRIGVILCGGNIDLDLFARWVLKAS